MDLPPDSPAAALAAAVRSLQPLQASPDRQAGILVRVLLCGSAQRPAFLARVSPAAVSIALLCFGIATAVAGIAPHVGWRWAAVPAGAAVVDRRPAAARPAPLPAVEPEPVPPEGAPPAARPPRQPAPAAESPARVVAAVRALRTEGQPARAERLALEYLRAYPRGALAEEALALAVEAAARAGDSRAVSLASSYLRRYPQGRFQRVAEQTLVSLR